MTTKRILTGIKPTERPHLGNYLGMIQPALDDMSRNPDADNYLFLPDIHSISSVMDAAKLRHFTYDMAASLLACGLDPEKVTMFVESAVPEISELSAYLMHVTPKGLMNRGHAYKASVDQNHAKGNTGDDEDVGISMGLYTYPILMAADMLAFDTTHVPVGKDQIQHVEFTRDIAAYFNKAFGETLILPEHVVRPEVGTVPGLDGRKMSKSYGNHLPIFEDPKTITSAVKKIVTDSLRPEDAKDPESNTIYQIFKAVATKEESADLAARFRASGADGIGYGEAKQLLADKIVTLFADRFAKYEYYKNNTAELDAILSAAAAKARAKAQPVLARVRKALGVVV